MWIVDGNNVMGSRPDGWWRDRELGMQRLVEEVDGWAARTGHEVLVVFDGRERPVAAERAAVLFAPDADDLIAGRVRRGDTVATSDRGLAARVAAAGAGVVGARAFRDGLAGDPR